MKSDKTKRISYGKKAKLKIPTNDNGNPVINVLSYNDPVEDFSCLNTDLQCEDLYLTRKALDKKRIYQKIDREIGISYD